MNFKFVLFVIVLFSLDSFAITGKDNWSTLRTSGDVMIQHPTFAGAFGPEGLFNACTTDDEFRSLKPVKNCLKYREVTRQSDSGPYLDYVCSNYETRNISVSRRYVQNVCVKFAPMGPDSSGECVQYDSVVSVYPTSFKLAVIEASGDESGIFLFSKTFALQSCD